MATKRMFSTKVLDTDAFLDMPLSAQALYFHLNLRADDDGFISNPKRIQSYVGASEDDLKLLVLKRFLIAFEDGVMVVKHWRMHNTIQKDRYNPTDYQEDLAMLGIKENKSYTLEDNFNEVQTIEVAVKPAEKPVKHKYGKYNHVLLTDSEYEKLRADLGDVADDCIRFLDEYIEEKGYKSKSHNLAIRRWVVDAVSKKSRHTKESDVVNDWLNA